MSKINRRIMDIAIYAVCNKILALKEETGIITTDASKDYILQKEHECMIYDAILEALGKNGDKYIWGVSKEEKE